MERIIFVGLHNKPYMAALDSGTKTGKLVDRIIKELPSNIEIIKSNILDTDEFVAPNERYKYADEWYWTHLPIEDDIIILLGQATHVIHRNNVKQVGKIIRVAHPASKRSHIDMNSYVINVLKQIKAKINRIK